MKKNIDLAAAFDAAVTSVLGADALERVKAMPAPVVSVREKMTDWEAIWENQMSSRYGFVPDRGQRPGHW